MGMMECVARQYKLKQENEKTNKCNDKSKETVDNRTPSKRG